MMAPGVRWEASDQNIPSDCPNAETARVRIEVRESRAGTLGEREIERSQRPRSSKGTGFERLAASLSSGLAAGSDDGVEGCFLRLDAGWADYCGHSVLRVDAVAPSCVELPAPVRGGSSTLSVGRDTLHISLHAVCSPHRGDR